MSRIIKFRAWHKQEKKMYKVVGIYLSKVALAPSADTIAVVEIGELELMQFTGLYDKNGKEIYEGDIVKANRPWENWGDTLQVVKYEHGTWNYSYALHEYAEHPERDWEVIGNIYEHGNLLTTT